MGKIEDANNTNKPAGRSDNVPRSHRIGIIRIAARHALQTQKMLGKEGQVDSQEYNKEMHARKGGVQRKACEYCISESNPRKDGKDRTHGQNVMEMCHHVVGIV